MKTISIISLLFIAVSCVMTFSEESENVKARDQLVQFEVHKTGPYDLVMISLQGDSTILKITDLNCMPTAFYKDGSIYFFMCIGNNEKTIWEIEEDLGRVMQVELQENDLKEFEKLKK